MAAVFFVLLSTLVLADGVRGGTSEELRLDEAVELAFSTNPELRGFEAEVAIARGRLRQADTFRYNPELGGGVGHRSGEAASTTDYEVSLSQEFELGGQRGKRARTAAAGLAAAEARLLREQRLLAARVAVAYSEAVRGRSLTAIETADAELAGQYASFTRRRFEAGAASQIERNLGQAAVGRAERRRLRAAAVYREAQAELAEAIGLGAATVVEPDGLPAVEVAEPLALATLIRMAGENRGDLLAFRQMIVAAEGRRDVAHAEAVPNLTLEGFVEREEGTDTIAGLGISFGLPLFNRNVGGIEEAEASLALAKSGQDGRSLTVERQVVSAYVRLESATSSLDLLEEQVLGTLEENLNLLERSFAAGKIGSMELLVFRREFVQSRRDHVEALAEAWRAKIALDLATGRISLPDMTTEN